MVIAGGGIIGSAVAAALAERGIGAITVVDVDLSGLYASSELNAGGARATWWQEVNIATCAATLEFFRLHRDEFGFREHGYLWLYDDPDLFRRASAKVEAQNAFGLDVQLLDAAEIARRFPLIDRGLDELVGATFSPHDGLVNPNAVRAWYRREAEGRGVRFLNRHYIEGIATRLGGAADRDDGSRERIVEAVDVVEIRAGDPADESGRLRTALTTHRVPAELRGREMRIPCAMLINCLGAWSPLLSAKIGVADPTEPVRRQISLFDVRAADRSTIDVDALGMIVDSSNVYFHPEGAYFLAGFSLPAEPPGYDFTYDGVEFFERHVWPALAHRCSIFERCRHVNGWAGLYAVTPDRSGIAGRVEGFANLFEAHSFTGRGVMQSYGVARAMAELVATGRYGALDLSALSRMRFTDPGRWVKEDLHI